MTFYSLEELVAYIAIPSEFQKKHNLRVETKIVFSNDTSALVKKVSQGKKYGEALYFCYNRMAWSGGNDWIFMCPTTQQIKNFIRWFLLAHDETQRKFSRSSDRIMPWLIDWIKKMPRSLSDFI